MSDVSQWSNTAGGNNSAAPDGAPEGMAPSGVNDTMREIMAAVSRWHDDTKGELVTGGTSNAYTLSSNTTHAALADQALICFRADRANTGSATLNVDTLGAKTIKADGANLSAGDIVQNQLYLVAYNATNDTYDLLNAKAGLSIGTDVQAWDAGLDDIAALAVTDGNFIVGNNTNWVAESGATARASLGLTIGTDVQAYDADLASIAALNTTSFGRSLLTQADAAAARTTLGAQQADDGLSDIAALNENTDNAFIVGSASGWTLETGATLRNSMGLGSADTVQFSQIELGNATDTTLGRAASGQLHVEGNVVLKHNATTGTYTSGEVYFSDSAPVSEGSDGDIWFEY